jgi:hypothetical protein
MKPAPIADASLLYASGQQEISRLYVTVDFRAMLVLPSYKPSAAHAVVDDEMSACPRAHEMTVGGYARPRLANCRLIDDPAAGRAYLDADDLGFGDLEPGERIGGAVIFRDAGSDRLSPLIAFHSFHNQGTTGGPVLLEWTARTPCTCGRRSQ